MNHKDQILSLIKQSVQATEPGATLILYGSYARGDYRADSDIDVLILMDQDEIGFNDRKRIAYPLYDIEFETGIVISPMLYSKKAWQNHRVTPFYENVIKEGQVL